MTEREKLKVSVRIIYDEFLRQNVPVKIIDPSGSLLEYTDSSGEPHYMFSTNSDKSSAVGQIIAKDKIKTARVAADLFIATPSTVNCKSLDEARAFLATHKKIVIKPLDSSGGHGVTTGITTVDELESAYSFAQEYSPDVIAQHHVNGSDVRLLVVAGVFCSAVERQPAHVIGDGRQTVETLITHTNDSPERSANYMSTLNQIDVKSAQRYLQESITTVPALATKIQVVGPANLSLGGSAHEATNLVTGQMIADAEKITQRLRLGICGVDMMWNQATNEYYLIEVNATPGIDMHNDLFWGTSSDAVERYIQWLAV